MSRHLEAEPSDGFFAMVRELQAAVPQPPDQRSPGPAEYCAPKSERRRCSGTVSHYDCQSLCAEPAAAADLRTALDARRRNTATGASAASGHARGSHASHTSHTPSDAPPDEPSEERSNDLVDDCPFFRNEIGGEEERNISLNWKTGHSKTANRQSSTLTSHMHRPIVAYGLSVLEFPLGQTHWTQTCYLARRPQSSVTPIERQDRGALYYRKYFYEREHQNWFGTDDRLGPVAVSVRKEKIDSTDVPETVNTHGSEWQYRIIVRTSELSTLRVSVPEEAVPNAKPSNSSKMVNTKEVIEYVAPEIQSSCLRLAVNGGGAEEQLLRLDEQCISRHYKVGVMYCRKGQATEEEMYNNQEAGPAFVEFLQMLGQTVRLKGFDRYKAGLDNKTDSTGLHSVYAVFQDCEIMFHVSTMLPYTPNNRQQLLRKRHIGNDIVTVVFQEPGAQKFTPKNIRSQFQHVFIVVRAVNPCTDNTHYRIAVSRSKEVSIFGPPVSEEALYPKGKSFTDLLLAKVINGENAAHQSTKFSTMATRTRHEYLKDLSKNYVTNTPLDSGQRFSLFSSLLKTGGNGNINGVKPLANAYTTWSTLGALSWPVITRDEGRAGALIDCIFGLSRDTVVLIEECSRQIVFVAPSKSILGWSWWGDAGGIRIYYHRGESIAIRTKKSCDAEELLQALALAAPSATLADSLQLNRNNVGQLGFHVQPDGVVTQVESGGGASRAGLRQGARLVEICTVAVCTLSHDQMVDLLKTSTPVTVTVIPPLSNGLTRGCCIGAECPGSVGVVTGGGQFPSKHRRHYDRSFSPPRSSASSGYGTGSSSKSYCPPEMWSPDTSLIIKPEKQTVDTSKVVYRNEMDYSHVAKSDVLESPMSHQNKALINRRHSQEITGNHNEYKNDKNWLEGSLERSDSSPRPQAGLGSRRGTPASGHQSPASNSEARLKANRAQRHSAGGNTSLQEDLMKLINPDFIENNNIVREEGILTQARPATVISSTSSGGSPAPNPPLPLPDARVMDWPSLVDTATRAMLQICEEQYPSLGDGEGSVASGGADGLESNETIWNGVGTDNIGNDCCSLRKQVNELEHRVSREVRTRRALEDEVKRLRHHNRRLREESMRAVQQLQRFTNWFFQTVERQ